MTIKLKMPIIVIRIKIVRLAISKTEYVLLKSFILSDDDIEANSEELYVSFLVEFIIKCFLSCNQSSSAFFSLLVSFLSICDFSSLFQTS